MLNLPKRIADKIQPAESGCWNWTASRRNGYGHVWINGKLVSAHREVYSLLVGPIPEGLSLDHLCRNPSCVNPSHLEPVTHRTNCLRGVGATAQCSAKTHCIRGHQFDLLNTTRRRNGTRRCAACDKARRAKRNLISFCAICGKKFGVRLINKSWRCQEHRLREAAGGKV